MRIRLFCLLSVALLAAAARPMAQSPAGADAPVYIVSYFEVAPGNEAAAVGLLKQYRDGGRKADGNLRLAVLQQIGRGDHFAIVEMWRDQKAVESYASSESTRQFRAKLQPLRLSPYDERPHRALAAGSMPPQGDRATFVLTHADAAGQGPARDDAIALLTQLAEGSRKEDGNVGFEILQQISRTNHSTIVEIWKDEKAFDRHRVAAPARQFREKFQPLSGALYDERVYRSLD